jgi:ribosomal-protein-serine acetyltransferase
MLSYQVDENLELRLAQERNAEEAFKVVRANLSHLKPWMPWATDNYSVESAREFYKKSLQQFADNEAMALNIVYRGKIVGGIGFNVFDWQNRQTEIGYWLAANQTGRGIMTKCCRVLINYAFGELLLNRIVIRCATENDKSRGIPERLGFTEEGILRQDEKIGDIFHDIVVYSILAEEWEKNAW